MNPTELQQYLDPNLLVSLGTSLATALVTLVIGWVIAGWAKRFATNALERAKVDAGLAKFLGSILRWILIFVTLIASADALGFETTSVMAIFASAGLAVGLALQGSLSNFASGVMILLFRPFTVNDVISGGGHTGKVMEIGLFSTLLMKLDGTKIIMPNSSLTGSTVENHTVLGKRRGTVDIGVDYGVDLDEVRTALTKAAQNVPEVLDDPGFVVIFVSFGGSSLDWQVHGWSTPENYLKMLEGLRVNIYNELNAAGIGIPFPQLDVHFDSAPPPQG